MSRYVYFSPSRFSLMFLRLAFLRLTVIFVLFVILLSQKI